MTGFLGFWDRVELLLATLPFPVQVIVMVAVGLPAFLASAVVVERVADLMVRAVRGLAADGAPGEGKEVR